MKKLKLFLTTLLIIASLTLVFSACGKNNDLDTIESDVETVAGTENDEMGDAVEYPITDAWVNRYNAETGKSDFAPCGYIDEYTSLVIESDDDILSIIADTTMYLGAIKGYQNEDETIDVYQVRLYELSENFVLTNDRIKLDYSGERQMIDVDGWIYMNGTTIVAVSPLYSD